MTRSRRLFVYGTLRRGGEPARLHGFEKRTDAPFPTITPAEGDDAVVEGEIIEVDDIEKTDGYEGCKPDRPEDSLYWRLPVAELVPFSSSQVEAYVGNPEVAERTWSEAWDVEHNRYEVLAALLEAELEVEAADENGRGGGQ